MDENIVIIYIKMLKGSAPTHRLARRITLLVVIMAVALVFYRHSILGFGLWEPALVTIGLLFLLWFWVGGLGCALGVGAYDWYLGKTGIQGDRITPRLFIIEWLFAIFTIILSIGLPIVVPIGGDYIW
jgi:hypothetical protein